MTGMLDKLAQLGGGELVPTSREAGAASGGSASDSPFDRFLDGLVPGEPPDDDFTRALAHAALGALLVLGGALVLAILPSGESFRESSFILVGKRTTGNVVDFGGSMVVPLIVLSLALLSVVGALWAVGPRGGVGPAVCAVQPGIGMVSVGVSAIPWLIVLLAVAVTLLIWALVCVTVIALIGAVLAGS